MKRLKNPLLRNRLVNRIFAPLLSQEGQSLIILAFIFVGLLAMLGIALDLGLVYIERVKIKRTVDAAALAAATELPSEEDAMLRAIEYISENGYSVVNSNIYVAGCLQDVRSIYKDNNNSTTATNDLVLMPPATGVGAWSSGSKSNGCFSRPVCLHSCISHPSC